MKRLMSMKRLLPFTLTFSLLLTGLLWSVGRGFSPRVLAAAVASYPLDPNNFASLGASPFNAAGTYTIDASKDNAAPALTGPGLALPLAGVFYSPSNGAVARDEIAVFTFSFINIPAGVTVQGARNANSRPIALLSQSSITIDGTINVSGANGANGTTGTPGSGGNGGNAGPGGGGGGGGLALIIQGGSGGVGFENGANGGSGGSVVTSGGGSVGARTNGGGGAFGGNGGSARTGPGVGGMAYGDLTLRLQGGSGGGGGGAEDFPGSCDDDGCGPPTIFGGGGGGAGGGAVELGAVGNLTVGGNILANGGAGGQSAFRTGGGGAGGAIFAHAPMVSLSGNLNAIGGTDGGDGGGGGGGGRVLVKTANGTLASGSLAANVDINGGGNGGTGVKGMFNSSPIVQAPNVSFVAGNSASNAQIATVNDAEDEEYTLIIIALPISGSGVTLTNLSIAGNGEVTANVAAACNATTSTFSLRVTDSGNLSATATLTVNITANQPPTLSYPANPGAVYGTGLTINPLTGPSDDVGVNSVSVQNITPTNPGGITVNSTGFVTVATTVPPGMYTVTIRAAASCGNTDANFTLGIVKATPVVTWNNPADIVYGTALSGTQLNTTANIPGSFIYTPAAGTVLNAGNGQMLSVSFSPTDASNYNAASRMVTINVLKATPVLTWNNPADIIYGTAVSATQLNATADVAGSFAYTPASGSVLNAGNAQSLAVTFTPTDTTNYRSTTKGVAINVLKATPAITWSNPADIIYGTAVSATQLNATANVAGAFTYTPPGGTVPSAGNGQSLSVNFTPTDTANYNSASKSATINVLKATSTVTWSNPADIIYGTALSAAQLNATANTAGTFSYTPAAGTVLNAGAGQSLAVNFTPTDSANYNPAAKSVTINVLKATPSISWGNPADIVYSTALSATQLNATANVTGTFNYTPGVNTILNAGNGQTLSVTFTPTNPTNYNPTTKVVQLNILKAPLTVNVNNAFRNQGDANPPFSGNVTGLLNGDVITASYGTTATTASAPGPYPITATLTDPGNRLNNYQVTNTPGTLTILNSCGIVISPATFLPASLALPYAQPLSASPSGTYSFSLFAGSLPPGLQIVNNSGYYTLQGTPTVPGTYTFTVRTQRSGSTCEAIRTYTLTIAPTVVPKVTCKTANPNGSYTVQFGYENTTGAAVTLPVGANNTFTSGAADRGQTTVFQVGIVNNAFSVTFANAGAFTGWAVKGPDGALRSVTPSVLLPNCP